VHCDELPRTSWFVESNPKLETEEEKKGKIAALGEKNVAGVGVEAGDVGGEKGTEERGVGGGGGGEWKMVCCSLKGNSLQGEISFCLELAQVCVCVCVCSYFLWS
jgi:hypothetical protein